MKQIAQSSLDMVSNLNCESSEELISKFECFKYFPGLILIKDKNSKLLALSQNTAKLAGWNEIEKAIGLTDYDMPSKLSELAERFVEQDNRTLAIDRDCMTFNIGYSAHGWGAYLWMRTIVRNQDGKSLGVCSQGMSLANSNHLKLLQRLSFDDQKISGLQKSASYILAPEHSPLSSLTPRQESIVFFMIRGKPMKEIAYILKISTRTVESHIEAIKFRLGCYTKGQVIEKAIDSGFLYYIPRELLH